MIKKEYLCFRQGKGFVTFNLQTLEYGITLYTHMATSNTMHNWVDRMHEQDIESYVLVEIV